MVNNCSLRCLITISETGVEHSLCLRKKISTLHSIFVGKKFDWLFLTFRVNVFLFIVIVCVIRDIRETKSSYQELQTKRRKRLHKLKDT
jgi:hypothetical protein